MAIKRSWVNCPSCGYTVEDTYGSSLTYFGSPVSTCPKCNNKYLNPWTVELAVMPIEWYKKHHRNPVIMLLICLIPFIALFGLRNVSSKDLVIIFILSMVIMFVLLFLYIKNTAKISVRTPGFTKSYEESEKRLSNPEYKQFLINSGYMDKVKKAIRK